MSRLVLTLVIGLLFLGVVVLHPPSADTVVAQSGRPAGTTHTGKAFRFNKVKEGIYHAIGTGALAVVGNSSIIVNDNDVIVVDDHVSPAAAWVLLEEIKTLTSKPVRTVINTHFHFDHAHGNEIFGSDVEIIGHEFTRDMLLKGNPLQMPLYKGYLDGMPAQIEAMRQRVAAEADAARKATLQTQLDAAVNNRERYGSVSHFSSRDPKNSFIRPGASSTSSAFRDGGVSTMIRSNRPDACSSWS